MKNEITVDLEMMLSDKKQLDEFIEATRTVLKELNQSIQELSATWEGETHDSFIKEFGKDYEFMSAMCEKFTQIAKYLLNAQKTYQECEDQVQQLISTIKI